MDNIENELDTFVILNKTINELDNLIDTKYFYYIYFVILNKIKHIYMNMKGIYLDGNDTPYSLLKGRKDNTLNLIDEIGFRNFYSKCLEENDQIVMYDNLKNLYLYCFGKIEMEILDNHTEKRIRLLSKI